MMKNILLGCYVLVGAISPSLAAERTGVPDISPSPAPARLQGLPPPPSPVAPEGLNSTAEYYEAVPGIVETPPLVASPEAKAGTLSLESLPVQAEPSINAITPLCPTLAINTTYNLSGTTTGGSYCYHFQVTQRAKTQVYLISQNANTNFTLTLVRHEENDTLSVLGTSNQPGNANEVILALTQPGHYYWLMDANASDGSVFQFGTLANTAADAYELNDTVSLSTAIPNDRTGLVGNMDSAQDVDYFNFVATSGQDLIFRLQDAYGLNEWVFQYYNGSAWASLSANRFYTLSGLPAPYTLNLRVLPNPGVAVNTTHTYSLMAGRQVKSSDQVNVLSTENLERVPFGYTDPYLTTQAHNQISWSIRLLDSVGAPVRGAVVNFKWSTEDIAEQTSSAISNASGIASAVAVLPDCNGDYTVVHPGFGSTTWRTEFDFGSWNIKVPGANDNEVGVGGPNYPAVYLGHICRQTLQ